MTRLATLLLLALLTAQLALSALPPEKQAALDGSYTAIDQKGLTALQQALARAMRDRLPLRTSSSTPTGSIRRGRVGPIRPTRNISTRRINRE